MNFDLKTMKPGGYLLYGGTKALSLTDITQWDSVEGRGKTPSLETLAQTVAWEFVALQARQGQIIDIPHEWQRGGGTIDEPPFTVNLQAMLMRTDKALQIYGQCFWFKMRNGRRVVELRWLDPASIRPDRDTFDSNTARYTLFERTLDSGEIKWLKADDVVHFALPGLREATPDSGAMQATSRASQVLKGIEETADAFFDTNGLPVIFINIKNAISTVESDRLESRLKRLFRQGRDLEGNKTVALSGDVDVTPVSFAPKDLAMGELEQSKINAILAAHQVPRSIVFEDSNYATAQDKRRAFVATMGARLQFIADTLNADADMMNLRLALVPKVNRHWAMSRDEANASLGFLRYLQGMTPRAAAYIMGITEDEFPDEIRADGIWQDMTDTSSVGADLANAKSTEIGKLRRFVKAGKHHKRPFRSDVLTLEEIKAVTLEYTLESMMGNKDVELGWQSYP